MIIVERVHVRDQIWAVTIKTQSCRQSLNKHKKTPKTEDLSSIFILFHESSQNNFYWFQLFQKSSL